LATAVFIKALYSLVIAIVVAVTAALTSATDSLGFMFAFGLETLFFWAIFVYRKQITARMVSATTGAAHHDHVPRMTVVQRGATVAARPFGALVGVTRRRGEDGEVESRQQESVLAGGGATAEATRSAPSSATSWDAAPPVTAEHHGSIHAHDAHVHAHGTVDVTPARRFQRNELTPGDPLMAPPAPSRGDREPPAPSPDHAVEPIPIHAAAARRAAAQEHGEVSPRASHEDVMRRARELRERQREVVPASEERSG
jgi:hypothetical protein